MGVKTIVSIGLAVFVVASLLVANTRRRRQ